MWAELGREPDNTHSGVRIKKGQESRDKKDVGPNNLPGNTKGGPGIAMVTYHRIE